jgi:hypothetical protein
MSDLQQLVIYVCVCVCMCVPRRGVCISRTESFARYSVMHERLTDCTDLPTGFALLFALSDIFEQLQRAAQEPLECCVCQMCVCVCDCVCASVCL